MLCEAGIALAASVRVSVCLSVCVCLHKYYKNTDQILMQLNWYEYASRPPPPKKVNFNYSRRILL